MQPDYKNKKQVLYSLMDLTTMFFENYKVSSITLTSKEKKGYFGCFKDNKFIPKLEARITEKAWYEIPNNFKGIKLGSHSFTEDSFSAIITINCRISDENSKKLLTKVIENFKSRSTILLNQFHGNHGRIFWENNYEQEFIRDLNELNEILQNH